MIPVKLDDETVIERRGASGARVIIAKKHTMKLDVERTGTFVRDQGAWLSRWSVERGITCLPKVTEVFATGYTMETVEVPNLADVDVTQTCLEIFNAVSEQLWTKKGEIGSREPVSSLFPTLHRTYVRELIRDVAPEKSTARELNDTLRRYYEIVDWHSLHWGLTHGDCIVDNVGYRVERDTRYLVLLDPIPPKPALPGLRAVDVGRIIQSMVGYEPTRYGRGSVTLDYTAAVNTVLNWYMPEKFSVNEARACIYFAIIHMLRAVRTTVPGTSTRKNVWYLVRMLENEADTWMR